MDIDTTPQEDGSLRATLLRLARLEENRAAIEACSTPYWSASPPTVQGHRFAATVLRDAADACLANIGPASRS